MKTLILLAILASHNAFAQISISTFASLSYEKKGTNFKDRIGGGFNFSYLWENVGIGLQWRHKEMCSVSSQEGVVIPFNTKSIEFFFHQTPRVDKKYFLTPRAGVLIGFGTPIKDKDHDQSLQKRKEDLKLMDPSVLAGVILELGAGVRLSPKFLLSMYVRNEGLVGMITKRTINYENGSSFGSLSSGIRLTYDIKK